MVIRATNNLNLERNIVAQQVTRKCCSYYLALKKCVDNRSLSRGGGSIKLLDVADSRDQRNRICDSQLRRIGVNGYFVNSFSIKHGCICLHCLRLKKPSVKKMCSFRLFSVRSFGTFLL